MKFRLALFSLLATACGAAPATLPSNPPLTPAKAVAAEVNADYVATPNGLYHASCVYDVGDAAVAHADGSVTLADGTTLQIAPCQYPRGAPDAKAPTTNGWVLDSNWTSPSPATRMTSTFVVPAAPSTLNGQLDYFFPGMEPADGSIILQPVLSYGNSPAGGGNEWGIASWSCGSNCIHSKFHVVNAGDTLLGTIAGSSCTSAGACDWKIVTTDVTTPATVTLSTTGDKEAYVWLFGGVLEAYNVSDCDEYPASGTEVFSAVNFFDATGAQLVPAYTNAVLDKSCATAGVTSDATSTTLTF